MSKGDRKDLLSQLREAVPKAPTTIARLRRTVEFLECCERDLCSPDAQVRYHVFHEISHWSSQDPCKPAVWDWLQEIARTADLGRQVDLRIGVLELVPEPPISWPDLFRLWDMWFDPQARWAVYAAYVPFPRRLHQHLRRYSAHRRRFRLPIPEFSEEEFHRVIELHSTWVPNADA